MNVNEYQPKKVFGKNTIKKVRFHNQLYIILIPSITEYKQAGLAPLLWMSNHEYISLNNLR